MISAARRQRQAIDACLDTAGVDDSAAKGWGGSASEPMIHPAPCRRLKLRVSVQTV